MRADAGHDNPALKARALGAILVTMGVAAGCFGVATLLPRGAAGFVPKVTTVASLSGDDIRGLVVARRLGRRRVTVDASLHGLPVGDDKSTKFIVGASKRPCSKPTAVDAADYVVWRTRSIIMANTEGDFHVVQRVRRRSALRSARSVRVWEVEDFGVVQRACRAKWELSEFDAKGAALHSATLTFNYAKLDFMRRGSIRGIVAAAQRSTRGRITVFASLHGSELKEGARYQVLASKLACSEDGDTDGSDFLVWRIRLTGQNDGDTFAARKTRRRAPLRSTRSVRVYDLSGSGPPRQLSCKASPKL